MTVASAASLPLGMLITMGLHGIETGARSWVCSSLALAFLVHNRKLLLRGMNILNNEKRRKVTLSVSNHACRLPFSNAFSINFYS